jgi:hypothetical protein
VVSEEFKQRVAREANARWLAKFHGRWAMFWWARWHAGAVLRRNPGQRWRWVRRIVRALVFGIGPDAMTDIEVSTRG